MFVKGVQIQSCLLRLTVACNAFQLFDLMSRQLFEKTQKSIKYLTLSLRFWLFVPLCSVTFFLLHVEAFRSGYSLETSVMGSCCCCNFYPRNVHGLTRILESLLKQNSSTPTDTKHHFISGCDCFVWLYKMTYLAKVNKHSCRGLFFSLSVLSDNFLVQEVPF